MMLIDNSKKFTDLREEYNTFYFESFKLNISEFDYELIYNYSFDKKIDFRHVLRIKKNSTIKEIIDTGKFDKLIISIGIIEGINYYKMTCCQNMEIECMKLNEFEKSWWRKLYYKGLGELRYLNSIKVSEEEFFNITSKDIKVEKVDNLKLEGNLILVGGGKDSNTSMEILNEEKDINSVLIVNPRSASIESAKVAGYNDDDIIIVERIIDKKLIEYNKEGFLNGHIPFSAVLAFISTFIAAISGKKYVVVSNEMSANEETVEGANHQYSKTFEFENDFREYAEKSLFSNEGVIYYSLLRPLYELQIVKIFTKYKKYLPVFKSCNVGSRIVNKKEIWCNKCPKCLFVYILLLSQLDEEETIGIIGSNMLNNIDMKEDFDKLIGKADEKPFECIGTKDEINAAMTIICNEKKYNESNIPYLIKYYMEECKEFHKSDSEIKEIVYNFNKNNNVPRETLQKIMNLLDLE